LKGFNKMFQRKKQSMSLIVKNISSREIPSWSHSELRGQKCTRTLFCCRGYYQCPSEGSYLFSRVFVFWLSFSNISNILHFVPDKWADVARRMQRKNRTIPSHTRQNSWKMKTLFLRFGIAKPIFYFSFISRFFNNL
jgi:hypothetical protein